MFFKEISLYETFSFIDENVQLSRSQKLFFSYTKFWLCGCGLEELSIVNLAQHHHLSPSTWVRRQSLRSMGEVHEGKRRTLPPVPRCCPVSHPGGYLPHVDPRHEGERKLCIQDRSRHLCEQPGPPGQVQAMGSIWWLHSNGSAVLVEEIIEWSSATAQPRKLTQLTTTTTNRQEVRQFFVYFVNFVHPLSWHQTTSLSTTLWTDIVNKQQQRED